MLHRSVTPVLLGCLSLASAACLEKQTGAGGSGGSSSNSSSASSGGSSGSSSSSSSSNKAGDLGSGTSSSSQAGSGGSGGSSSTGSGGSSSGGSSSSSTGSGGKTTSSGGTSASGGKSTGGTSTSGGTTGSSGGSSSSSSKVTNASCTFDINAVTASAIPTVGVVTWGTNLSNPTSAHIDFGLDTNYGMSAPVNKPSASGNKTLLLGMKQKKTYHYRIVATNSGGDCSSEDKTITTGSLANGLPTIKVANKGDASALFGGFLITTQYQGASGGKAPALIFDKDGEVVWAYAISTSGSDGLTCARMSFDGNHMWINSANVGGAMMGGGSGKAIVHRVAMDGTDDQDLSSKFTGLNHQLTVLPDETVAYYAYGSNGCEDIKEYSPSGTTKTIVNAGTAQGGSSACHVNNIQYSPDDALVFSDLDSQVVVKVSRKDGSTVWTLNAGKSPLSGVTWKGSQHGIHVLDANQILLFNNNSTSLMGMGSAGGTGDGSKILQIKIDPAAKSASSVWSYKGPANLQNDIMGDLQRLSNGNTIIGYSTKGAVQEVDKDGKVLTDWTFPLGGQFGYIEKRATLYGPPPR